MNLKKQLENKLKEIADFLLNHESDNKDIGVLGGTSGIALFHFYYADYEDDDRHAEKGTEIIYEAFQRIQEGYNYPTFCDGIAGACSTLELLKEEQFIELEEDIITPEVDTYLFEMMSIDIKENNYDFLHGAIGYGYYFLKRYQNATTEILKKRYKQYLDHLINFLKNTSIESDTGIWWQSEIMVGEEKFMGYNLGLSHGVSSILNFLSRLVVYPDFSKKIDSLLKLATHHIIGCKHADSIYTSSFPNWTTVENPKGNNSRLGWCYGDLGIGISLLRAGEVLRDNNITKQAIQILKRTTKRRDITEAQIKDAGLCHGAFGVMHIYEYIYKKTKDQIFKETADHWATVGINLVIHPDGYGGYKKRIEDTWELEDCLLDGISGIGLALLSYLRNDYNNWDEALLIG